MADQRKPHWPALDGLRALSVGAVVLYHCGGRVAENGYAGVDVFFVLSGFLITRLLLDEHARSRRIDLRAFYVRRALRLLPALVAVCVVVVAVAVATHRQVAAVGQGALAALFYVANLWIYTGHDTVLLQHTWTLSLEEQFYLVWPVLLVLLLALPRRRRAVTLLLVLAVLAALLAAPAAGDVAAVQHNYLRATGLLAGSALGWYTVNRRLSVPAPVGLLSVAALAVLLLCPWKIPGNLLTDGYSLASAITLVALLALTEPAPPLAALMSSKPLLWLGRRSYGIYLWHLPVLSLALHQAPASIPQPARAALGVVTSLVVSGLAYRSIEQPFLRRKARFERLRPADDRLHARRDGEPVA